MARNRIVHRLAEVVRRQIRIAVVGQPYVYFLVAQRFDILQCGECMGIISTSVRIEHLQCHHRRLPIDTSNAFPVVADSGNRTRDVRAVVMIVARVAVPVYEVVAVDVIDVAVAVVI